MLKATGITKRYEDTEVLHAVSAQVKPGDVTVVMGPSGGGKSTLVRTMSLLESVDEGEIILDGRRIEYCHSGFQEPEKSPWPTITVVFQQLFLWPHKTLAENVLLPAKLRHKEVDRCGLLVDRLGIADVMERYPNQVSVGQRQRAALVRSLLLQPRYLLLDEITAALDVEQIVALTGILIDYVRQGMGLLIVTHHLGFARKLLTYRSTGAFLFLDRGVVIEEGNAQVFETPSSERVRAFLRAMKTVGWAE